MKRVQSDVILSEAQRSRRIPRWNHWAVSRGSSTSLGMTAFMSILATEELHDIAPPVDYSLLPPWVIFVATFCGLALVGLIVWLVMRGRRRPIAQKSPRQLALDELEIMELEVEKTRPYRFSIRVSDVLRRYVTEQFALPVTKQTSVEFLTALAKVSPFSPEEKTLLEDFLSRCDLIKFACYDATTADSRLLLEEAMRFVRGGEFATALA
jgi:hypothetical protein